MLIGKNAIYFEVKYVWYEIQCQHECLKFLRQPTRNVIILVTLLLIFLLSLCIILKRCLYIASQHKDNLSNKECLQDERTLVK